MGIEEYRRRLAEHANTIGYLDNRIDGTVWVFSMLGGFSAVVSSGLEHNDSRSLTSAKITLTKCMKARYPGNLPSPKPKTVKAAGPSKNMKETWLHAFAPDYDKVAGKTQAGKWMMFVAREYADDTWRNVSAAITSGDLAFYGKISTAAQISTIHVLCVYVPDYRDRDAAMVVRERLRAIGFRRKIYFKNDAMTQAAESGSLFGA